MYLQGQEQYDHHLKHYGHPADTGFIDVIRSWKAENFAKHYGITYINGRLKL